MKETEINKTNFPDIFPHVPLNYKNFNAPVQCNFNKWSNLVTPIRGFLIQWEGYCISYRVFLPKMFNLDLIMRKQSERLRLWNILQNGLDSGLCKVSFSWKTKTGRDTSKEEQRNVTTKGTVIFDQALSGNTMAVKDIIRIIRKSVYELYSRW